jgi:Cytochrome oxidase complex assembly protein 1
VLRRDGEGSIWVEGTGSRSKSGAAQENDLDRHEPFAPAFSRYQVCTISSGYENRADVSQPSLEEERMSTQPNYIPQGTSPALMPNQGRSWLGRNWKWLLAAVFVCGAVFVVGIFTLVMGAMRGSDVAREATARAQANTLVGQRLGTPISEGWMVSGSINVSPGAGDADLSVPISGPKGKGTVYVKAQKAGGEWTYSLMLATIEGSSERIDLLASAATAVPASEPPSPTPAADAPSQPAPSDPSVALAAAPQPTASDPAASAPDPVQSKAGGVIASAQYANDPNLRCDLLEVKRVSGGALLARWRFINTGTKSVNYDFSWDDIYYIDPAGNKKYANLTIDGKRILDVWWGTLPPGEQRVNWVKYPAPPATSKRISLNVPKFQPFEDVPVSE